MRFNIRESVETDSEGNPLSPEQIEFFKNSKIRDRQGRLLVCYHGSKSKADFDTFKYDANNQTGDNFGKAFYFTTDKSKAQGYSVDSTTDKRVQRYFKDKDVLLKKFANSPTDENKKALDDFKKKNSLDALLGDENYDDNLERMGTLKACYLNITNPYVADAHGAYHFEVYGDIFNDAHKQNSNGIVVHNVIDNPRGKARPIDVYIAFDPNQIKSITNKTPTNSDNINENSTIKKDHTSGVSPTQKYHNRVAKKTVRQIAKELNNTQGIDCSFVVDAKSMTVHHIDDTKGEDGLKNNSFDNLWFICSDDSRDSEVIHKLLHYIERKDIKYDDLLNELNNIKIVKYDDASGKLIPKTLRDFKESCELFDKGLKEDMANPKEFDWDSWGNGRYRVLYRPKDGTGGAEADVYADWRHKGRYQLVKIDGKRIDGVNNKTRGEIQSYIRDHYKSLQQSTVKEELIKEDMELNFDRALLDKWIDDLNANGAKYHQTFSYTEGGKYIKVSYTFGGRYDTAVFAFVDADGNIYKPAGWKTPAKGVRARIDQNPPMDEKDLYSARYRAAVYGESVKEEILTEKPSPAGYEPTKKGIAYKVFKVKNGKLYPPMVANAGGADTPIGVWLDAEEGEFAGLSKTGRPQVKSTGSGNLSYRPGWHLGDIPRAKQFDRLNKETGEYEFPKDFVWAECEYAMDVDYQPESDARGYERTKVDKDGNVIVTKSDKYQHSLAGLPKLPTNGYYKYRTNPNPDTVPWVITGQMKVNRLLSDAEVNAILEKNGIEPIHRQGGDKTLAELGLKESLSEAQRKKMYEGISDADFDDIIAQFDNRGIDYSDAAYDTHIIWFKDDKEFEKAKTVLDRFRYKYVDGVNKRGTKYFELKEDWWDGGDSYFSHEQLMEFGSEFEEALQARHGRMFDVGGVFFEPNNMLVVSINVNPYGDDFFVEKKIDMRKVKTTKDLNKYIPALLDDATKQIVDDNY